MIRFLPWAKAPIKIPRPHPGAYIAKGQVVRPLTAAEIKALLKKDS